MSLNITVAQHLQDIHSRLVGMTARLDELTERVDALTERLDSDPLNEVVDLDEYDHAAEDSDPQQHQAEVTVSPALTTRLHGWHPDNFHTQAELDSGEEVDGAIIMARRAICGRAETHINADIAHAEYEGVPAPGMTEQDFVVNEATGTTIGLPKASDAAKAFWAEQADAILGPVPSSFGLDAETAKEAYCKAGPLWLAMYDHDYLMSLPYGVRQAMAESVIDYAPVAGTDLANDILRVGLDESRAFGQALIEDGHAE